MRIAWLAFAQRDLLSISTYHESAAGTVFATRVVQRIVRTASNLTDSPHLGRPSESTDGIHELQIPRLPYLLPYRVVGDRIEILRVFHETQDRPSAWQTE